MPKYFGASVIITTPIRATIHRLPRVLYLLPPVFRCKLKSHHFFSTETPSAVAATLPPHLAWTSKKPETNIPLTTRLKAPLIWLGISGFKLVSSAWSSSGCVLAVRGKGSAISTRCNTGCSRIVMEVELEILQVHVLYWNYKRLKRLALGSRRPIRAHRGIYHMEKTFLSDRSKPALQNYVVVKPLMFPLPLISNAHRALETRPISNSRNRPVAKVTRNWWEMGIRIYIIAMARKLRSIWSAFCHCCSFTSFL